MCGQWHRNRKITNTDGEDKDIIALARDERDAVVQVFFMRSGKLIGRDHFYLRIADGEEEQGILTSFCQAVLRGNALYSEGDRAAKRDRRRRGDLGMAGKSEKARKCICGYRKKGTKERLVELAKKNARMVLSQDKERIKREEGRTIGALKRNRRTLRTGWNPKSRGLRYFQYQRI